MMLSTLIEHFGETYDQSLIRNLENSATRENKNLFSFIFVVVLFWMDAINSRRQRKRSRLIPKENLQIFFFWLLSGSVRSHFSHLPMTGEFHIEILSFYLKIISRVLSLRSLEIVLFFLSVVFTSLSCSLISPPNSFRLQANYRLSLIHLFRFYE